MKNLRIAIALCAATAACGNTAGGTDMLGTADLVVTDGLNPDLGPADVYLLPCAGGNDCTNLSSVQYLTYDDTVGGQTAVMVRLIPSRPLTTKRLTFTTCSDKALRIIYRNIPAEQNNPPHFNETGWVELAATFQPFPGNNVIPFQQDVSREEHLIIAFVLLVANPDKGNASCLAGFKPTQIAVHSPPFDYIDVCKPGGDGAPTCLLRPRAELGGNFAETHTMMSVVAE